MQNNIYQIIRSMFDNNGLCEYILLKYEDAKFPGLKVSCQKIRCTNCPLYHQSVSFIKKYGDCNDQSV